MTKNNVIYFDETETELYEKINNALKALLTNSKNPTPPTSLETGQWWFDTMKNEMNMLLETNEWLVLNKQIIEDVFVFRLNCDRGELDEFILHNNFLNLTMENVVVFDEDFNELSFIIDSFNSHFIHLDQKTKSILTVMVFHPDDIINNPLKNKCVEITTASGQTQFQLTPQSLNKYSSVWLNELPLLNTDYELNNDVLTLNGLKFQVTNDTKLFIMKNGFNPRVRFHIKSEIPETSISIPNYFDLTPQTNNDMITSIQKKNAFIEFHMFNENHTMIDLEINFTR